MSENSPAKGPPAGSGGKGKSCALNLPEPDDRFVPKDFIGLMGKNRVTDVSLGDHIETTMTILFSDIREFTAISETMTPQENFAFINSYVERMAPVITMNGGIVDKYMGDGIMALFPNDADDALHCAVGMLHQLALWNNGRKEAGHVPVKVGIGLNTGLMMLGIVGSADLMETTVISDAVNLASRIESMTKDYQTPLLISEHTYYGLEDAFKYHTRFIDRVRVKGKKQCQSVYEVFDADPPQLRKAKQKTQNLFEEALAYYHLKKVPEAMDLLSRCLHDAPDDTVAQVYHRRCEHFFETGIHEGTGEIDLVVPWDVSLAIGDPTIDEQHRDLFAQVGSLARAIRQGGDYAQLRAMVEFLDSYVAKHFATEEHCMAEANYPFLRFQIDQHRRFTRYFEAFKEELKSDLDKHRVFLLFRAQILVIDWLVNHTSKLDKHFGKHLDRTKEAGSCSRPDEQVALKDAPSQNRTGRIEREESR